MFKRNVVDEKTKNKVIEIEELTKALETRLMARVDELEKQLLELQMKQKRDDGFFSMLMKTLQMI